MLKGVHLSSDGSRSWPSRPEGGARRAQRVQVTTALGRSGSSSASRLAKNSPLTTLLIPAGFFDPLIRVIIIVTDRRHRPRSSWTASSPSSRSRQQRPGQTSLTVTART